MLNYGSNLDKDILEAFFQDNWTFSNYSTEHYFTLLLCLIGGIFLIKFADRYFSEKTLFRLVLIFSVWIWISQVAKVFIRMSLGNFNHLTDLPLELCNILTFLMPLVFIFRSRWLWSIIIFWILAGTFQALITPTLQQSFPHYEYWRYFLVHAGLVICVLFPAFHWGWTLTIKDALMSALALNVLAFVMYNVNKWMGSNYMYMNHKPPGKTLYSILGEWPIYILQLEFVLVLLFGIILLPFYLKRKTT